MTMTKVKAMVAKGVTVVLLAGAFALAAPAKAEAQQFAVGVQIGYPHSGYAGYYGPDYYARLRFEEARRHAEWVRAHERDGYRYGYGYRGRW
jgi:hypothetical protein